MWMISRTQFKLKLQSRMFAERTEATIRFHKLAIYLMKSNLSSKISLAAIKSNSRNWLSKTARK